MSILVVLGFLWSSPTAISAEELTDQALGFYTAGRLERPNPLAIEGHGYVQMPRARARGHFYGTRELIQLLEEVSADLANRFPGREPLRIGDLSSEHGGPISIHNSHQNGLDVDLLYLRRGKALGLDPVSPVTYQGLSQRFDLLRNWELVKLLFGSGKVSRVFVSPAVKYAFCQHARKKGELRRSLEILRRIQAYNDHSSHLHVRLYCPVTNPRCVAQAELPLELGIGCSPPAPETLPAPATEVPATGHEHEEESKAD